MWNRTCIDHVQITATETLGVEGRGGDYETAGTMRDMVQHHVLRFCALVAIEPPAEWHQRAVRDEKVKALRAVRKLTPDEVGRFAVRGQYGAGTVAGERVPPYREEQKVVADSHGETYAALGLHIENVRWAGVPFYLQSGKCPATRATEIAVELEPAPHTPFNPHGAGGAVARPNRLVATISPHEGVVLQVAGKLPGQETSSASLSPGRCRSRRWRRGGGSQRPGGAAGPSFIAAAAQRRPRGTLHRRARADGGRAGRRAPGHSACRSSERRHAGRPRLSPPSPRRRCRAWHPSRSSPSTTEKAR